MFFLLNRLACFALALAILAWCVPVGVAQTPPPAAEATLGSAAYLPEDVAVFANAFDMLPRLQAIRDSRAVQSILALPALQELQRNLPPMQQLQADVDTQIPGLWGLGEDILSQEMFFAVGGEVVPFSRALSEIMREIQAQQMKTLGDPGAGSNVQAITSVIKSVVTNGKDLHLPPVLLGFKVRDGERANDVMAQVLAMIPPSPMVKRMRRDIGGATFMVIETGFAEMQEDIVAGLTDMGVDPDDAQNFATFLATRPLTLAVGVRDGYLLISAAEDEGLLKRWGHESNLAASDAFAPLRKRLKPGLINIQYRSADLENLMAWDPRDLDPSIELFQSIPERIVAPILRDRVVADLKDLRDAIPAETRREALSFAFQNRGIESWSFDSDTDVGENGELGMLAHRGRNPIALYASTGVSSRQRYDLLAMVVGKLDWYLREQLMPNLSPEMQLDIQPALAIGRTFLGDIHGAIDEDILPSTAGTDAINVIDWGGLVQVPGSQPEQVLDIPVPRIATAMGLNDAKQYRKGMARCYAALNHLLQSASATWPSDLPSDLALPVVVTGPLNEGQAFWLDLPPMLGEDAFPTGWVTESMMIGATSRAYVGELAEAQPQPLTSDVIQLNAPSQNVTVVEFGRLWDALETLTNNVPTYIEQVGGDVDAPELQEVQFYSRTVLRSLRALRAMQRRTFVEDGRRVTHAWTHIEDIGE